MAEEFGLTHIDPNELGIVVRTKLAELNPLDRAAFEMRVGRILSEAESGGAPKPRFIVLSYALFVVVSWFIWRPAAVVLAILASANIRGFAIRHALFWSSRGAIAIGCGYGIVLGALVGFGMNLSTHTATVGVAFGVVGFWASGYIGYGIQTGRHVRTSGDEKRTLAQISAIGSYFVTLIALLLWKFFGPKA